MASIWCQVGAVLPRARTCRPAHGSGPSCIDGYPLLPQCSSARACHEVQNLELELRAAVPRIARHLQGAQQSAAAWHWAGCERALSSHLLPPRRTQCTTTLRMPAVCWSATQKEGTHATKTGSLPHQARHAVPQSILHHQRRLALHAAWAGRVESARVQRGGAWSGAHGRRHGMQARGCSPACSPCLHTDARPEHSPWSPGSPAAMRCWHSASSCE